LLTLTLPCDHHTQGIILWAGENWSKFQFAHTQEVEQIEISPCENFMVAYAPNAASATVWDIRLITCSTFERQRPTQRSFPLAGSR